MARRKNFPHDMGGQKECESAIDKNDTEAVFKEDWHGRALAITVLSGAHGKWTLDESRHARETLPPEDYQKFSYYEKWLSALANLLVRHGLVDRQELAKSHAHEDGKRELMATTLTGDKVHPAMEKGNPTIRPSQTKPKFKLGDKVKTLTPAATAHVENGHTRLPGYAAQARGVIVKYYQSHVLPDSHAHGLGESPEHLYAVEFEATELWGNAATKGDKVVVDCWESYLR